MDLFAFYCFISNAISASHEVSSTNEVWIVWFVSSDGGDDCFTMLGVGNNINCFIL